MSHFFDDFEWMFALNDVNTVSTMLHVGALQHFTL